MWMEMDTAPKDGTRIMSYCYIGGLTIVSWERTGWYTYPGKWRKSPKNWQPLPPTPSASLTK